MARGKIMVVDDEENIQELLRYNLEKNGYGVKCLSSGEEALTSARSELPDVLLLDLMLPGVDGLEVCRILKNDSRTAHIPILMLTAKGEESDIVTGLELGADDYITKPFSPRVLLARVRAVLRRKSKAMPSQDTPIRFDSLVVDPGRHEVLLDGKRVELTHTEFRILHFLASRPRRVFSRYQIIDAVHGENYTVTDRSVDVQIAGLRRKLGTYSKYIETVRGVGYRFGE